MTAKNETSDFDQPFEKRYLACAEALSVLRRRLMVVGMGKDRNFAELCVNFVDHGAETFRDMR